MLKSSNMLRTRRKDNNVKPNRRDSRLTRLDRKSSRGMIYENEELRLRTININEEVERSQHDMKKLRRENDSLKKEVWHLRHAYDKLGRILEENQIKYLTSSSSTSCSSSSSNSNSSDTSETESCNSCSEESSLDHQVETTQNLENMKNLHTEFDHLSIVPEETSENSEKNSNRTSLPATWNYEIKPDQIYDTTTTNQQQKSNSLPQQQQQHQTIKHFFSPIRKNDNYQQQQQQFYNQSTIAQTTPANFYENMILLPKNHQQILPTATTNFDNSILPIIENNTVIPTLNKSETDLIVKMDNETFKTTQQQRPKTINSQSTFSNGGNLEELLNDIETISQDILKITNSQQQQHIGNGNDNLLMTSSITKPYKSELNVVLMPNPMPLLGFDKYRNIEEHFDNNNLRYTKSLDNLLLTTNNTTNTTTPSSIIEHNPFYFNQFNTNTNDNYVQCDDYFDLNYNPIIENQQQNKQMGSKTNLLDLTSSEQISSENEENLKFQTTKLETNNPIDSNNEKQSQQQQQQQQIKSPKLSIRRKVSIHFKGKKDKLKKQNSDSGDSQIIQKPATAPILTTTTPLTGGATTTTTPKKSIFDIKFNKHQKTPSLESKKSTDCEPKTTTTTTTSTESKISLNNNNNNLVNKKTLLRKSTSISPERTKKQLNIKDELHKKHKKSAHQKKLKNNTRRNTIVSLDRNFLNSTNHRERSFSLCSQFGGTGGDDYGVSGGGLHSEKERTNSLSSCETIKTRKMSNISNIPFNGKVPWCACWGNGCV